MRKLTVAYFGSPSFSADFLESLLTDPVLKKLITVNLVVTQPDRPVGRKQVITPTPVKTIAQKHQIKCLELGNWDLFKNWQLEIRNFDLCLVYAFAQKIPASFLSLPQLGFWCLHPSLLPLYRGPSPIAYPLMLGDDQTGVSLFLMDEIIDHGPLIGQTSVSIAPDDNRPLLEKKLTALGFLLFKEQIINLLNRARKQRQPTVDIHLLSPVAQDHQQATYTRLLTKQDGFIPLLTLKKALSNKLLCVDELPQIIKDYLIKNSNHKSQITNKHQISNNKTVSFGNLKLNKNLKLTINNSPEIIFNLFRALTPWPGLWTLLPNNKRLKLTQLAINNQQLAILSVQLEGKQPVDFKTFNQAYRLF